VRLLVLGGTKFLGRHVVEAALAAGHEVTLFNRGLTAPSLFPEVEQLRGDRDGGLAALGGRSWDAAVDTSGYVPRLVRASAELLADAVAHYTFVSSISVYRAPLASGQDESAAVVELSDPSVEEITAETYGGLKVLCEQVVAEHFPSRHASLRAGLIVGPYDPSGRFTYWPFRIARGGDVLVPGDRERWIQFVDGRDLAGWILLLAERRTAGTFNATGPEPRLTMGELVEACSEPSERAARLVWVDGGFLAERGVGEWMELPLWVLPENEGILQVDIGRAVAADLAFRPLRETIRATLELAEPTADAGLRPEREAKLLTEWQARV
jgi:2'-hydroxyisoflavone reductase